MSIEETDLVVRVFTHNAFSEEREEEEEESVNEGAGEDGTGRWLCASTKRGGGKDSA